MFWPCETRTSICRNLATISSGLYRFLAITVLLDVKDIPQVGPLQWGWIKRAYLRCHAVRQGRQASAKDKMMLTLLKARKIVNQALLRARELNVSVSVAVCDTSGRL